MRLGIEVILLLVAGIIAYATLTIYEPLLAEASTFYLLLAVSCTLAIILLEHSFPVDKPNMWIIEAAAWSFINMMLVATIFSFTYRVFTIISYAYVMIAFGGLYYLLAALGEDLMTYGLPLALEKRTPIGKGIYLVFLGLFAGLHYPAYKSLHMLLQPFVAACINMYIVKKYRNVAGVVIGHFLTDLCLVSVI